MKLEQITIKIKTENDAFRPEPGPEVARLLRELADKYENQDDPAGKLFDANGNTVGTVTEEGTEDLKSTVLDFATQTRVCDAFKASKYFDALDIHHINAEYEHGQWWIIATLNEGEERDQVTFSVVDATGGNSVDGFDFEEV